MKISAITGRGAKRDFIDLYTAAQHFGVSELVAWFRVKFAQANYSLVHVLKSLTYFTDAEKDPMPDLLRPIAWPEVKGFFIKMVPTLLPDTRDPGSTR